MSSDQPRRTFREDIIESMARLETKMDAVLDKDKDKEKRLRSLERWKYAHGISVTALLVVAAKLGIPLGEH